MSLIAILISIVGWLVNLVIASWMSSQRADKGKLEELAREVAEIQERDKHTPTANDMAALRELAGEMRGTRRELEAYSSNTRRELERLHDRFDKYETAVHRAVA